MTFIAAGTPEETVALLADPNFYERETSPVPIWSEGGEPEQRPSAGVADAPPPVA